MRAPLSVILVAAAAACSHPKPPATTDREPPPPPPPTKPIADVTPPAPPTPPTPRPPAGPMTLAQAGIVTDWMDASANPCTDFFEYACGTFMKTAEIPPDRTGWGAIEIVTKANEDLLHTQLESFLAAKSPDPAEATLGHFYAACMDESGIEKRGTAPLVPLIAGIVHATDQATVVGAIAGLHAQGISPFFNLSPQQDYADATQVIGSLDQGGLGLPDRDYYLSAKGNFPKQRAFYTKHVERMFALAGDPKPALAAADVLRIETAIARLEQTKVERRDPHKVYHRIDRAGLIKIAPAFDWDAYFTAIDMPQLTAISVSLPAYFTGVTKLIASEKPAAIQHYLVWTTIRGTVQELPKAWLDERLAMSKELSGVTALPPRWRKCTNQVDDDLGDLLGQVYVKLKFGGDAKARAVELTVAIMDAMRTTLGGLAWMDDATRTPAIDKLAKMAKLIGFPDHWKQYTFAIAQDDYFGNVRRATAWELHRQWAKIGKPVDRADWQMTPPTVNAYYDSSLNEIALPAGQLQPPFFGPTFHPAVNFGSTGGGTIGHEITHGFDDEGSQFDAAGNLRDWWSKQTKAKFGTATQCVVDQYGQYEAVPKVKLDGKLTAGENIADIGGVKIGYAAYTAYRKAHPETPTKIEGMTDDQVYFLAYGQSWCDKRTPASLETAAHSNPHSPPRWRVNGVIVNQPGFGAAFGCPAGSPMNPGKPCSVW